MDASIGRRAAAWQSHSEWQDSDTERKFPPPQNRSQMFRTLRGAALGASFPPPKPRVEVVKEHRRFDHQFDAGLIAIADRLLPSAAPHWPSLRLAELNYYSGSIDGLFGPQTDRAVKEFQAKYFSPAEADGLVGPKTWAKLFGDATSPPPADQGSFKAGDKAVAQKIITDNFNRHRPPDVSLRLCPRARGHDNGRAG